MKKLMMAMAAAAMVGVANAVTAYTYIDVERYEGKAQDASYYKLYTLNQDEAKTAMDTDKKVTYDTCAAWLGNNFAENSAAIADYKWFRPDVGNNYLNVVDSSGGYAPEESLYDAIVIGIYDNGTDQAYNVFANRDYEDLGELYWGDFILVVRGVEASSGWRAVPEPTSALLMLLGMAGLCLRRKQRV